MRERKYTMTTDEMLDKVNAKLANESAAPLMTEETMLAVQALGRERDEALSLVKSKDEEINSLKATLDGMESKIAEAEFARKRAETDAKEKAWTANELGKFVSDIANGIYEGQEIAAARRVYDLNSGSLSKKRINASNYDSGFDAELAFRKEHGYTSNDEYTYAEFMAWCWTQAKN